MSTISRWDSQLQQLAKPKVKEGAVVNACIKMLYTLGCFVWRQNTGAWKPEGSKRAIHYGLKGCGDIIGITPTGRFICVECKAGKNKQQASQEDFQRRVEEKNGIYILAYSIDDLTARQSEIMGRQV
jgi:hypothetical protein